MANHKSAKKRIRQTVTKTATNRNRISRVRTFVKKVETAITSGNYELARSSFGLAEKELRKAVSKGVLKLSTVSRRVSRLSAKIKNMQQKEAA